MEFQIGDRVILTGNYAGEQRDALPEGATGTIVHIVDDSWPPIGVCWDVAPKAGHDCMNHCKYGYGWFVCEDEIEIVYESEDDVDEVNIGSLL